MTFVTVGSYHAMIAVTKVVSTDISQGTGTFHSHTGISEQRTYVDGVCHGPAVLHTPQGDTEDRVYENGKLHGTATFTR